MTTPTLNLELPAPLENIDLEQNSERKLNAMNSFENSINIIKEMITNFKDKNHKSKLKYRNQQTLSSVLKSVNTAFSIGAWF